jgi:lipopolysaccharide transport system permease protein
MNPSMPDVIAPAGLVAQAASEPAERHVPSPAPLPAATPLLTLRASSGWAALNFREVWHFRDLLMSLATRDLKLRYKQTALGVIWVILQPLMAAGIFSFVFGRVAQLSSDGAPYFVFSFAGLLGWNLFNNTVTKASGCLVGNVQLISKVFFPRLVLPFSTVPSTLVDFGVSAAMMLVLLCVYRIPPHWGMLLLPLWIALLLSLSLGIGLCTSALTVSYRDVQYILPVFLQVLLYASPIAYSLTSALARIPKPLQAAYMLNPLSGLLEAFRWSLLGTGQVHWGYITYSAAASLAVFILGSFSFKAMERRFADVI